MPTLKIVETITFPLGDEASPNPRPATTLELGYTDGKVFCHPAVKGKLPAGMVEGEVNTPRRFLVELAREWNKLAAKDKPTRAFRDSIPPLRVEVEDLVRTVLNDLALADPHGDIVQMLDAMSRANVDAFLEFAGGKDSELNKRVLQYGRAGDMPEPAKKAAKPAKKKVRAKR